MSNDETPWRDKETLERLYHDEGLSQGEIADRLGTSKPTVHRWMRDLDVEADSEKFPGCKEHTWNKTRDRVLEEYSIEFSDVPEPSP